MLLTQDHGEVAEDRTIVGFLFERGLKTVLGCSKIIFLPVHVAEGVPGLPLRRQQLQGLAEQVFRLASVLREEVEDAATKVEQLRLLFLILNKIDRLRIE